MPLLFIVSMLIALIGVIFALFLWLKIKKITIESARAQEISNIIKDGAMVFLNKEYRVLSIFIIIASALLAVFIDWRMAVVFIFGAVLSALTGNIGMRIATTANAKTAESIKGGLRKGLLVAFNSGSATGMIVVSFGLLGIGLMYILFRDPNIIYGFGFGASLVALFARVGGGIYTKAADVGADLVGKIEVGIPEDDPRNPAVIADNVGDNVGDVAGMGADLFESYVDAIIAAMAIGSISGMVAGKNGILLPIILAAAGIISSLLGNIVIGLFSKGKPQNVLNRGIWGSIVFMAIFAFFLVKYFSGDINIFYSFLTGLFSGAGIGMITEYFTSADNKPAQNVALAAQTGAGTNIIAGLALGMKSTFIPVIIISAAMFLSYSFGGIYGIAIAAVGMLSTLGITLATDTYGPVADNAAGIAEMAGMGDDIRKGAEELDAVGNTTAAIGKGFAIGSAVLTAIVLVVSYGTITGLSSINLMNTQVIIGTFIGGMLPFLFSSFLMNAVGRAASKMVDEVRRQFKEIPGLMAGTAKADYKKCINISTGAALKEMIVPGLTALIFPVCVGLFIGKEALGGLLIGSIVTGFLLAIMMANAGGAWDNAKKFIEAGNLGGKNSTTHKAAVVGDTVGDPFKDTAGPSLNILLKLMAIIAIIIAPLL